MRTVVALLLLVSAANACPWWGRCGPPRPVVYPCYPPPVYYSLPVPPPVIRVVEVPPAPEGKPVVKEDEAPDGWCHVRGRVVYDGDPIPVQKEIPNSGGAYTEDWVVNPKNH